jgi:hypothetical protein
MAKLLREVGETGKPPRTLAVTDPDVMALRGAIEKRFEGKWRARAEWERNERERAERLALPAPSDPDPEPDVVEAEVVPDEMVPAIRMPAPRIHGVGPGLGAIQARLHARQLAAWQAERRAKQLYRGAWSL